MACGGNPLLLKVKLRNSLLDVAICHGQASGGKLENGRKNLSMMKTHVVVVVVVPLTNINIKTIEGQMEPQASLLPQGLLSFHGHSLSPFEREVVVAAAT